METFHFYANELSMLAQSFLPESAPQPRRKRKTTRWGGIDEDHHVAVVLCLILALAALVPQARAQPLPSDQACREIVKTLDRVSTFRDRAGKMTGTAERQSNGTTIFRDGQGRLTGSATAPRR
jgi:hypothetical protein